MATAADGLLLLLEELEHSTQPESAKAAFREMVLQKLSGVLSEREQRVQYARHLLSVKTPRPAIRDRLQTRFGIERAQAYRDIDHALQTVS